MAWFRRSTHDPAELERLKSEINVLRNTIEAHDRRRREAGAEPPRQASEETAPETRAQLAALSAKLAELDGRIAASGSGDAAAGEAAAAQARLDELAAKLTDLDTRVPARDAERPASREDAERLDELATKVADLDARIAPADGVAAQTAAATARLDELATKLADLDARITSVSTELANQVTELGNDIEALGTRPPGSVDEATIGELRDGQTRLANEQARYQIAFREDLARLAEQFRRPGQSPADNRS